MSSNKMGSDNFFQILGTGTATDLHNSSYNLKIGFHCIAGTIATAFSILIMQ